MDCVVNLFAEAVGCIEAISGDVFPDFFQIFDCIRMKNEFADAVFTSS